MNDFFFFFSSSSLERIDSVQVCRLRRNTSPYVTVMMSKFFCNRFYVTFVPLASKRKPNDRRKRTKTVTKCRSVCLIENDFMKEMKKERSESEMEKYSERNLSKKFVICCVWRHQNHLTMKRRALRRHTHTHTNFNQEIAWTNWSSRENERTSQN